MPKVIVVSTSSALGINNIGGTESLLRRIKEFDSQNVFEYYLIGHGKQAPNVRYFESYRELAKELGSSENSGAVVIKMYLPISARLLHVVFRRKNQGQMHRMILTSWSDRLIKRLALIVDAMIFPYNGGVFTVSDRQHRWVSRICKNTFRIYPLVSKSYIYNGESKNIDYLFLGRLDKTKGIDNVLKFFEYLKEKNTQINCVICGIRFKDDIYSEEVHKYLQNQTFITYREVVREEYSSLIEKETGELLKNSKYFLQPYNNIYGTIDAPLLLLEACAAGCKILTSSDENAKEYLGKAGHYLSNDKVAELIQFHKNNFLTDDGALQSINQYQKLDELAQITTHNLLNEKRV